MQQNVSGMDTEQGRQTSQQMDSHATQVSSMVTSISSMLAGVQWSGPDHERFSNDWNGSFAPQAKGAADSLSDQARVLRAHADRQDEASR